MIVAAHPDDESIGLGGLIPLLRDPYLVHLTDGAPRSHPDRDRYAAARARELGAALACAGISLGRRRALEAADQECAFEMAALARRLAALIEKVRPRVIYTHPYEGGHPDHDSAAWIVAAAMRLIQPPAPVEQPWNRALAAIKAPPPAIREFTSYHNADPHGVRAGMRVGEFLAADPTQPECRAETIVLSADARHRKRRMLACFETQQHMLASFPIAIERFRLAPQYDFARPPHPGRLFYEDHDWGMDGAQWRRLACAAWAELFQDADHAGESTPERTASTLQSP
jgi:LmbE family N-acetylglucosaminyl deacetylase